MAVKERTVLMALTFLVLAASLGVLLVQLSLAPHGQPHPGPGVTARASMGKVSFCINGPPSVIVPCNATLSQGSAYSCALGISDPDGNNVTIVASSLDGEMPIFNVSPSGAISFTPGNDDVGNYSYTFHVTDTSGCENDLTQAQFNFTVDNINDLPFLALAIPDASFSANTTLSAFFLDDHFTDPDGDPLAYTASQPSGITVTILPSSEVRFSSSSCIPGGELVTFTAIDPFNASADSNPVTVRVNCQPAGGAAGAGTTGASAGGGGGGAASLCKSEWECEEWEACMPSGVQRRRCYDLEGCEDEKQLEQLCTYEGPVPACQENWLCSPWSRCFLNATQERTCEDLSACGSALVRPPLSQGCVYYPTCDDGIQNGNETGVDCGGECAACAIVQRPSPIDLEGRVSAWIILIVLLALLLATAAARYYRAEIAQLLAALGFMLSHRREKEILLDAGQRRSLFERILRYEARLDEGKLSREQARDALAMAMRDYAHEALAIPRESTPEEIAARCRALKLSEETSALVTGMCAALPALERADGECDELSLRALAEELRTLVCLTSAYTHDEIVRRIEEMQVRDTMTFPEEVHARMMNAMRAVQFGELEAAKKEYVALLSRYGALSEQERTAIYPELVWAFHATRLQSEVVGMRVVEKGRVGQA